MNKFQAQIKQSPPVTMLHTLTCPTLTECTTGDVFRVVRAPNVEEAVLDLVVIYMNHNIRRNVCVCRCIKGGKPGIDPRRRKASIHARLHC